MQETSWWLIAAVLSAVAWAFGNLLLRKRYKTNFLPGPIRLPIIGRSPWWGKVLHKQLESLAAKYGDVFGLYLGNKYAVVLNDYSTLKQVLLEDAEKPTANGHSEKKYDVEEPGDKNELIKEEISNFLGQVDKQGDEPLRVTQTLIDSASDVICDIIHPKKLEESNPKRKRLREAIQSLLKHVHPPDIHIPFSDQDIPTIWDADKLYLVTEEVIKTVRQESINGYSHVMLKSTNAESIDKELTKKIDFVLLTASSSIIAAIEWTLLALATQPEVQEKCMAEIDSTVGRKDFPDWKERHHLPYTIAVCMEAQRLYCIHPVALVKQTFHDINLGEHCIPKDSVVISNVWSILHDPVYWLAPDQFHPERFLSSNRKNFSKPEFYVPLSYTNSGDTLADILAYTYVVSILQRFSILPHPVDEEPDMEGRINLIHRPYSFDLIFIPRE